MSTRQFLQSAVDARNGARELLLIDQDVLSVGPTRSCASWTEWQRMRFNWWNALVPDTIGDHVHSPMNLVDNATRLKDAERIHIWAATGVTEQLFIALLLHLADAQDIDPDRISLRLYEGLPGRRQRIVGMGELNEANLSNEPAPLTLSAQIIDDYQSAWAALTSSDPSLLEGFSDSYPQANRWLREAMDKAIAGPAEARKAALGQTRKCRHGCVIVRVAASIADPAAWPGSPCPYPARRRSAGGLRRARPWTGGWRAGR